VAGNLGKRAVEENTMCSYVSVKINSGNKGSPGGQKIASLTRRENPSTRETQM